MSDFFNPTSLPDSTLGVTQINKVMKFESVEGVFIPQASVKFYFGKEMIREATIGDGLTLIAGTNTQGVSKTYQLTLNGTDFANYKNKYINVQCTFFVLGDIELKFKIRII